MRAAAACNDCETSKRTLWSLVEDAEEGAVSWRPRWDSLSLVMKACRRAKDIPGCVRACRVLVLAVFAMLS
jgi:hypothetical protein